MTDKKEHTPEKIKEYNKAYQAAYEQIEGNLTIPTVEDLITKVIAEHIRKSRPEEGPVDKADIEEAAGFINDMEKQYKAQGLKTTEDVSDRLISELNKRYPLPDEVYNVKYPKDKMLLLPKAVKNILKGEIGPGLRPIRMKGVGGLVSLDYAEIQQNISTPLQFTPIDYVIHNATSALLVHNRELTEAAVYKQMTGNTEENVSLTETQTKMVRDHLERGRLTIVKIDASKEKSKSKESIDGPIYSFRRHNRTINGLEVSTYYFSERPILLDYAIQRDQILRTPMLKSPVNNSERFLNLQCEIVEQIEYMKSDQRAAKKGKKKIRNTIINLETLFTRSQYFTDEDKAKPSYKVQAKRARDYIHRELEYYIELNYIQGWSFQTDKKEEIPKEIPKGKRYNYHEINIIL